MEISRKKMSFGVGIRNTLYSHVIASWLHFLGLLEGSAECLGGTHLAGAVTVSAFVIGGNSSKKPVLEGRPVEVMRS